MPDQHPTRQFTAECERCDGVIRGRERDGRTAWDHENYPDRLTGGEHFPYPKFDPKFDEHLAARDE